MFIMVAVILFGAACFGLGRVKHPANLKLSAVKAEIATLEGEASTISMSIVARRLRALL